MKRTLKRELKVLEIVKREAIGTSRCAPFNQPEAWVPAVASEGPLVVSV
jgi:hypothetical protein